MNIKTRLTKLEKTLRPLSPKEKEDPSLILFRKYSEAIFYLLGEGRLHL